MTEEFFKNLFQLLKDRREHLGISQRSLAEKAKIGKYLITRYESGEAGDIKVSTLLKICDALVLDPSTLIKKALKDS